MTTALAGIALEHCTQLKWELVGLGIAHVAAECLSHDGESHLLSGNIFPLEKIHFQAFSPGTKRRPARPATKHSVNLADVRHVWYGREREDRHVGQRLYLRLSDRHRFCRLADFHESGGKGPNSIAVDRSPTGTEEAGPLTQKYNLRRSLDYGHESPDGRF